MATAQASEGSTRGSSWMAIRLVVGRGDMELLAIVVALTLLVVLFRVSVLAGNLDRMAEPWAIGAEFLSDFWHHLCTALLMCAVILPVRRRAPDAGWRRALWMAAGVAAATALAVVVRAAGWYTSASQFDEARRWAELWNAVPAWIFRFGMLAVLPVLAGEFDHARTRSVEAMRGAEADRARLEQETLQSRLSTLEAQIEPHFLFNTLANVRRLYETDAAAGEAMIDQLMRYLETALPSMRNEPSTLDRERRLIEAYLELQRVRMGARLAYTIDIAPALRPLAVPPMMLLTLVENAIKHGLAPQRGGGSVEVSARVEGATLRLEVADTGRGWSADTSGGGTGLANIRARLQAMYGAAAAMELGPRLPKGFLASIRLPAAAAAVGP